MKQQLKNQEKKEPGLVWRLLIYYCKITKEFLNNTALNGLKYLTYNYLTFCEKLLFLSCFIAASFSSSNFAINIVNKWQTSPVMTVKNSQTSFITKEPFPAITICNMNQVQRSKVKDFDVHSLDYAMLQKICFQELNYSSFAHTKKQAKKDSFDKFIVKNAQSCADMVVYCKFGNIKRTCTDLFRDVLLDEGLCCSFNVVHPFMLYKGEYFMVRDYTTIDSQSIPLDWSPEKGFPQILPNSFYPRTSLGGGISNGFTIILYGDIDNYYCSSTNGPGFKVSIHNPIDTPFVKETGLSLALGYQTSFRVTPLKEEAVETLRTSTKPKERQCYFSDEYPLEYFRYYTRRNCEMECDAEFLLAECNCIPYHMPMLSNNFTMCNVKHFDCVVNAEKDFIDPLRLGCKKECLSNCNDLSYIPKPFFTALDNEGFEIKSSFFRKMSKENLTNNYALLTVFFQDHYYRGTVKNPYMGLTEFLSQTGGIMGLMMGFSIISLLEMAYFFIIKPFITGWRKIFNKNTVNVVEINAVAQFELQDYGQQFQQNSYTPKFIAQIYLSWATVMAVSFADSGQQFQQNSYTPKFIAQIYLSWATIIAVSFANFIKIWTKQCYQK